MEDTTLRVNATCTVPGKVVKKCSCGETIEETIPAIGHKAEWVIDKNATDSEEGLKHQECSVCHEKIGESVIIPKLVVDPPENQSVPDGN